MGVHGDQPWGASLKWPFEELQELQELFLMLLHWFPFSAPEFATWGKRLAWLCPEF